ncbi:hypothetical protein OC844_006442 [Tilletia horrida]|nr:hypothetical protein OC844_006442 [Tilletia horrida]
MSEMATGPSEKTDEEWQPILVSLAEQWDDLLKEETQPKDGKKRGKGEETRGKETQREECASMAEGQENEEDGDDDEQVDDEDGLGVPRTPRSRGRGLLGGPLCLPRPSASSWRSRSGRGGTITSFEPHSTKSR